MCCIAAENPVERGVAPDQVDLPDMSGIFSLDKAQPTGAV